MTVLVVEAKEGALLEDKFGSFQAVVRVPEMTETCELPAEWVMTVPLPLAPAKTPVPLPGATV
jgi:hypothetical protein